MFQLNQKDMADETGFSQSYICGIEKGIKTPNADFLLALSVKFGLSFSWLVNGFGPMLSESVVSGIEEGKMFLFEVGCDNMEPTFMKGDKIVIDPTGKELQDRGTYLFDINSRKTLKRCFKIGEHTFKLTNDKPAIKNNDLIFDSSMECLGRAVWMIREIDKGHANISTI